MRRVFAPLLVLAATLAPPAPAAGAPSAPPPAKAAPPAALDPSGTNGFSLAKLSVPRELVRPAAPGADLVRVVDAPRFVPPDAAPFADGSTRVLGVEAGGEAHAYPVHLIERHWAVNDALGGVPIVVFFDPMSGAPSAFRRRVGDRTLSFGVSGLVYDSAALFYDRETRSLWSPLLGRAIAGPLAGAKLAPLRVRQEVLDVWLGRAPGSALLAPPSQEIDYALSPYRAYWLRDEIPFPVGAKDERFHAKDLVLGVVVAGKARAYLGSILTAAGGRANDELAGRKIHVVYSSEEAAFTWDVPADVAVAESYWFAWKAFHPDTEVWKDPGPGRWKP